MTSTEKFLVPTDSVEKAFEDHLKIVRNKRILFSAPFGAGKSFFLTNFFERSEAHLSLAIHPVDYAVSSNEDIFELIKFDILTGLIEKYETQLELTDDEIPDVLLVQEFMSSRLELYPIIKDILPLLLHAGDKIKTALEAIETQFKKYNEFKEAVNSGEQAIALEYLVSHRTRKGSVREDGDYITALIKKLVNRLKEKTTDKKFVFILDDLDRLDPEHVFRLFNIFTAHHDSRTDKNKFDFDQVIFVCDVSNIHHMFRHKYGMLTDFQGYIDKFYSSHIFSFDFKAYIKQHLSTLLTANIRFAVHSPTGEASRVLYDRYHFKSNNSNTYYLIEYILSDLIDTDQIKMRSFERYQGYQLPYYHFTIKGLQPMPAYDYPFLVLVYTLQQFFPRWHELKAALEKMTATFAADYAHTTKTGTYHDWSTIEELIQISLPFIQDLKTSFIHALEEGNCTLGTINEKEQPIHINYEIDRYRQYKYKSGMRRKLDLEPQEFDGNCARPNPYWFLLKALEACEKNGFLQTL